MNKEDILKYLDDKWNVISMTDDEAISYYETITGLEKEYYEEMTMFDIKDYLLEYATNSLIEENILNYEEAGKLIGEIEEKWKKTQ